MSTEEKVVEGPPRSEPADPLLGKVLNTKFKILSMLATGGMGTIYRGEQLPLGRPVAIKVLIPNQASRQLDPNFHKRFFLEASILAKLQHPNIVTVFDYGRIEGVDTERYFMAMEYLEGETLFRRVRRLGRLPPPEAMRIARQIARGLREAHKHGVVHRDLKPSNIMLCSNEDGEEGVKILDFGLVKVLSDDSEELTQQGAFLGSPRFMSPEQIAHGKVDLRTDVYSLGVILYQMLCGKVPFESDKSIQILMAHLQQPVPRLKERNPEVEVPEVLEGLAMRCLAKEPDSRPATMDAFIQLLGECARSMGLSGFGGAAVTSLESLSGIKSGSATIRALKEAVTLPAPEGAEDSGRHSQPSFTSEGRGTPNDAESAPAVASTQTHARPAGAAKEEARTGGKRSGAVLAMAGVAVAAGVLIFVFSRNEAQPQPAPAAPPPAPTETAPKRAAAFNLLLESTPAGAEVLENGAALGQTPLQLSIENDVVRAMPRRFTIQKEGFQPYSLVQGQSEESVRVLATLVPAAAPAPTAEPTATPGRPIGGRPIGGRPRPPATSAPTTTPSTAPPIATNR